MANAIEPDGLGGWVWDHAASRVIPQLSKAGVIPYLWPDDTTVVHPMFVTITADPSIVPFLRRHPLFMEGGLDELHADVGPDRRDFRSINGAFGKGSLQIVVDEISGNLYADVDRFNIYQDLVNAFGHSFLEVLPHWLKRKPKQERA